MLIQQFCITFITMTETKRKEKEKFWESANKLKKVKPFTTNNKNKVLKGINKFVQEVCNYGKEEL